MDYPREEWDELFDAVVISGEVGMRKPEPAIYRYAADKLQVDPAECVFVDDLGPNVKGAVAVGMVGVKFVSAEQAVEELEALFGFALR
jgi:epoxide hydrolase-like predicted phosphatase